MFVCANKFMLIESKLKKINVLLNMLSQKTLTFKFVLLFLVHDREGHNSYFFLIIWIIYRFKNMIIKHIHTHQTEVNLNFLSQIKTAQGLHFMLEKSWTSLKKIYLIRHSKIYCDPYNQ